MPRTYGTRKKLLPKGNAMFIYPTREEFQAIKAAAAEEKRSDSEFIRHCVTFYLAVKDRAQKAGINHVFDTIAELLRGTAGSPPKEEPTQNTIPTL